MLPEGGAPDFSKSLVYRVFLAQICDFRDENQDFSLL
jgi:hypothetical protein